jgi:peptidyl-prolyl cis-trans isomerase-like 2
MGRNKSKQKDRAYITASEWKDEWGGKSVGSHGKNHGFKRLPFNCCAITFTPVDVQNAVVTDDGTVMDIMNAVPYVQKFKKHPVLGTPLSLKDLTRITFHTNDAGEICCPVLGKVFNENTHIVCVKTSGNVYCWEALDELCLKPKNLKDLITEEPFKRSDIIHIQDPKDLSGKNFVEFDHVKKNLVVEKDGEKSHVNVVSDDAKRALGALGKETRDIPKTYYTSNPARKRHDLVTFKPGTATWNTDANQETVQRDPNSGRIVPQPFSHEYVASRHTTGAASKSFTSTAMNLSTKNEREMILKELKPKQKGYVRMHTSLGDLNIELHCDLVPKTCENFMALAQGEYYNGTKFHRLIPNFMIQGGDPTGTGTGGTSVFGPTMEDEIHPMLKHDGRGQISMANSGPNTNGSQFFILFKSAKHLDFKHSVFGKVVGGFDVLSRMEKIQTDDADVPVEDITITGFTVFVNPYTDLIAEEEEHERKRKLEETKTPTIDSLDDIMSKKGAKGTGVGRYLSFPTAGDAKPRAKVAKHSKPTSSLSNFDSW